MGSVRHASTLWFTSTCFDRVPGHFGKVFKGTMQLKEDSDDVDVVAIKTIQGDVIQSRQNIN